MYRKDANISEEQYNNIWTIASKVAKMIDEYEWVEDCIEAVEKDLGIKIDKENEMRTSRAVQLIADGYEKVDEFINYGVTTK